MGLVVVIAGWLALAQIEWKTVDNEHCKFFYDELISQEKSCKSMGALLYQQNIEYESCLKKKNSQPPRGKQLSCEALGDQIQLVAAKRKKTCGEFQEKKLDFPPECKE